MSKNRFCKLFKLLFILALIVCCSLPAFAGKLNITYERVVTDEYGNEIAYETSRLNSINDLPANSPWREYLNTKLQNGKTIYEYALNISNQLGQTFNLNLSDCDSTCCSYKNERDGSYNLNLYNCVHGYSSSSKTFVFLHEFGHVVMLNSYPSYYNFSNLDYGDDNKHYLDEILPNYNTAWVEGWANAFGALNNGGMAYSYNLNDSNSLAGFLQNRTFDEMTRNELFVAQVLYKTMINVDGGQASSVYDVFAKSAPHFSLYDFCKNYVQLYPQNKVELAKILVENSFGKVSLKEFLLYVNGGSYTVSKELYAYLQSAGMLDGTASNNYSSNTSNTTTTTTTKTSFWSRIVSFFKGLFGKKTDVASEPTTKNNNKVSGSVANLPSINNNSIGSVTVSSSMDSNGTDRAISPVVNEGNKAISAEVNTMSLKEAQEEYLKYYAEYTELISSPNPDMQKVNKVRSKYTEAYKKYNELKNK